MEPLSAISLAGTIVQLIDFGCGLLSKGRKIYNSADGALIENSQLEMVAINLMGINKRLNSQSSSQTKSSDPTSSDVDMERLIKVCDGIAKELLDALSSLKSRGAPRRWQSFRQAFKYVLKKEKIDDLVRRMDSCRAQIAIHLLTSSRYESRPRQDRGLTFNPVRRKKNYILLSQNYP